MKYKIFSSGAFQIGVANVVSAAVPAIAMPILTRLYQPETFGVLAAFIGMQSFIMLLGGLRYEQVIPIARDDEESLRILSLYLRICCATIGVFGMFTIVSINIVTSVLKIPLTPALVWLALTSAFFMCVYQGVYYYAIRLGIYKTIYVSRVVMTLTTVLVQIFAYRLGSYMLIVGMVIGYTVGTTLITFLTLGGRFLILKSTAIRDLRRLSHRYKDFSLFYSISLILNNIHVNMIHLLFISVHGNLIAGWYLINQRLFSIPQTTLGTAIQHVFLGRGSQLTGREELKLLVYKIYTLWASLTLPFFCFAFSSSKTVFPFIFGKEWIEAGRMTQWIVPGVCVSTLAMPLTELFTLLKSPRGSTLIQITLVLWLLLGAVGGVYSGVWQVTLGTYSVGTTLTWAAFLIWVMGSLRLPISVLWKPISDHRVWWLGYTTALACAYFSVGWVQILSYTLALVLLGYYYWRNTAKLSEIRKVENA